jgi:hypothetical protein
MTESLSNQQSFNFMFTSTVFGYARIQKNGKLKTLMQLINLRIKTKKLAVLMFVFTSAFCEVALSQQNIKVSQVAWSTLSSSERELIQKSFVVSVVSQDTVGVIIDNQGVDESTRGTNGGAALGGSLASAAYVDSALRGRNYSAVNQLAFGILGAMIGSTLDSKANAQYHYRYAVKFGNGNIQYFDEVSSDPFRHPVGVCVSVPSVSLVDQQLCTQTADSLRTTYLHQATFAPPSQMASPLAKSDTGSTLEPPTVVPGDASNSSTTINCKLGTLAPVRTSPEKCSLIKGNPVQ